jgi:hypothetical protein
MATSLVKAFAEIDDTPIAPPQESCESQGIICVACPGVEKVITPPQMQLRVDVLFNAGVLQRITV